MSASTQQDLSPAEREYLNYSQFSSNDPLRWLPEFPIPVVQSRSQPVTIKPIPGKTGMRFRVTGTLKPGGKQRKQIVGTMEEAEAVREEWERTRMNGFTGARPRVTTLTYPQIKECEAVYVMIEGEQVSLKELVKLGLIKHREMAEAAKSGQVDTARTYRQLYDQFLQSRDNGAVSVPQHDTYRIRGNQFGAFVGWETPISQINAGKVEAWLEKKKSEDLKSKKSWNNYRADISTIFQWAVEPPRKWLPENPVSGVKRYNKRALAAERKPPARMEVQTCIDLMAYLETHEPKWCVYFAIALFAGIRPDVRNGEMAKLAKCIERDGLGQYYSNGYFHLTPEITKERDHRQVKVPANLAAWLEKHPPTPGSIRPGDYKEFSHIRKMFKISHDALRHTAISAFMSRGHSYAEAANQFGNSEPIIKKHYLNRMSAEEGARFFAIFPTETPLNVAASVGYFFLSPLPLLVLEGLLRYVGALANRTVDESEAGASEAAAHEAEVAELHAREQLLTAKSFTVSLLAAAVATALVGEVISKRAIDLVVAAGGCIVLLSLVGLLLVIQREEESCRRELRELSPQPGTQQGQG